EELAADIFQRPVHLALGVGEHAVGDDALGEPRRLGLAVAALDPDQRQHALADGGDLGALDLDRGARNALNQRAPAMMSGIRRARRRWIWSFSRSFLFFSRCSCS